MAQAITALGHELGLAFCRLEGIKGFTNGPLELTDGVIGHHRIAYLRNIDLETDFDFGTHIFCLAGESQSHGLNNLQVVEDTVG